MSRFSLNRLWVQFSAVIVGVVIIAAATMIGVTFIMRPQLLSPAERLERAEPGTVTPSWLPRMLTRDTVILIATGGVLAIGGGIFLSRRMTAPLDELARGATAFGKGDFAHRVTPAGSTELVALATSFNQMAANLEEAELLRSNLLTDVAHELRTPLTVLQGNLRALLDDVYPLEKAEVARLYDQTRHLNRLVDDLHVLAQAEARQLPLHLEMIDANQLVQSTAELYEALFETKEITLGMVLPDTPSMVRADRARITQVLQNLLTNALRHTPPGGAINVDVGSADAAVQIAVADSGDGIEVEHLPYVFNRFYRTDRARDRDSGGAGLGLALVRAIVESHGGQATVASTGRGQGSTFTILLPREPAAVATSTYVGVSYAAPPPQEWKESDHYA
jgi:signal transduction histidine kinase